MNLDLQHSITYLEFQVRNAKDGICARTEALLQRLDKPPRLLVSPPSHKIVTPLRVTPQGGLSFKKTRRKNQD